MTILADEFGLAPVMPIQGTTTGVWANPTFGLTAHSGGSNSLLQTAGIDQFDLSAHTGCLVVGADVWFSANPSAQEYILCSGVNVASGNNTASGAVGMFLGTDGQVALVVRPRSAANGDCGNSNAYSGAITTSTRKSVAFVVDFSSSPWTIYVMVDGVYTRSYQVTMTGAIGAPSNSVGMAIGGNISAALAVGGKVGAGGSGARVRNVLWWRTPKSVVQAMRALGRFQMTKLLNQHFV